MGHIPGTVAVNVHKKPDRPARFRVDLRELNIDGIDSPVKVAGIVKFERQNPNIAVNDLTLGQRSAAKLLIKATRQISQHRPVLAG